MRVSVAEMAVPSLKRTFFSLGVLFVILSTPVSAQPTILGPGTFVAGKTITLTCYITVSASVTTNPLSWTVDGVGVASTSESMVDGPQKLYTIVYSFVVIATDNRKVIKCKSSVAGPSGADSDSFDVYVRQPPENPSITGPTEVVSGKRWNWVCVVDGASGIAPSIDWYYRNAAKIPKSNYTNKEESHTESSTGLTIYTVTSNLTLDIVSRVPTFGLECRTSHFDTSTTATATVTVTVKYPPQVDVGTDQTVTEEAQVTLSCTVTSSPSVISFAWYKDGVVLNTAGGRYTGGTANQPSLTIRRVGRGDAGVYKCGASNSVGSTNSTSITLTVEYRPVITYSENPVSGVENSDVTISCLIEAIPIYTNVYWYRISTTGASTLIDRSDKRYSGGTAATPSLTILGLTQSDRGLYRCRAENKVGTGQGVNVQLEVTNLPIVTLNAASYTSATGDSLTIPCSYDANPQPANVTWTKNSQIVEVSSSGGKYSGSTVDTPSLTISQLTSADAGIYVSSAVNTLGSGHSADVTVTVTYAPKITIVSSVTGTEPQSVTLTCTVNARPSITSLTWYEGGQVLDTSDRSVYSGGTLGVTSLTILSVGPTDAGSYYCVATNSVGKTSSDTITLAVHYFPIITVPDNQIGGAVGEDVTLTVNIDANPALDTIQWVHMSQSGGVATTIDVSGRRYSGGTIASPSLVVKSLVIADMGSYTVRVSNSVGTRQAVLTVAISYPPTTPTITYNTNGYKEGEQILLTCSTSGFPQPQYEWYHNSQLFTSATGPTLTVTSASPSDKGDYRCHAFNSQGNADATVNVVIFYKPRAGAISNRTVTIGQKVNLDCVTDANPAPTSYSWTHDGLSLGAASSSRQLSVTVSNSSFLGRYDCLATNQEGTSDPIPIFIKLQDDDGGTDEGLSTTTLILIIIICIILLIVIILIIVYCCTSGRCARKDNNVAPSEPHPPPPPVTPITNKPLVMPEAGTPNGIVASSASHVGTTNATAPTSTVHGRINLEDDKTVPPSTLNGAALRHGMTISVPGIATPRPHHLPPLGQDGTPVETESAQDDKPRKKKRRRQKDGDEAPNNPDLNV